MPFPAKSPIEKLEHALRTERDHLRAQGNARAANAINSYLSEADTDSKQRFYDILTKDRSGSATHGFSQEDIWHEMRALGCDEQQAIRSLTEQEDRRDD